MAHNNNNKHSDSALYHPIYYNLNNFLTHFLFLFLASSVAQTPQPSKSLSVGSIQGKALALEALKRDKRKTAPYSTVL